MGQKNILLACLYCHGQLYEQASGVIECRQCGMRPKFSKVGNIYSFLNVKEEDIDLSIAKWNEIYKKVDGTEIEKKLQTYLQEDYPYVYPQITEGGIFNSGSVFLEIGCGPMFLSSQVASKVSLIVGIDFSLDALMLAQKLLEQKGITNYLLIHGDIKMMPIASSSVDFVYGGGVLEHFKDSSSAISEIYRILKDGGRSFNTVPYLNIGSLTYRQMWGNIPNLPVLRQIYEFIHIEILGSRHMKFGYELSFTSGTLKRLHKKAGFKDVAVSHFDTHLVFEYIKNNTLRKLMVWMATNLSCFWPMVKAVAVK